MEESFKCFPSNGILPKKETGALDYLSKYPDYDGRGILIAVLDTGVDPGAPGLKLTSTSKHKIIDLIDATGAGNVDISTEIHMDVLEDFIIGLTGRKLKIPSNWENPSKKFFVGIKTLFELCSSPLKEKLKKERKEKLFQPLNEESIVQIQKKINEMNRQKSTEDSSLPNHESSKLDDNEFINSLKKEDLKCQLEFFKEIDSKIKDVGPVYDCLVWNDGYKWRACVDTSECGNLKDCKVLTNFKDSHEYGTFSYLDMLNYSVRILPDEHILQIVTDSGSHGTHVASIISGYYEDTPELNGIAPGAQIISIKIGDNRLNGMETGFALVNACRYIIENNCDLVNYSFGEPINYCSSSPNMFFARDLIEKFGVIVCASAGNNGPGIETINAPSEYSSCSIGVGAYVSKDMINAEHSLLGNGNSMLFTWSSRGPQLDGHIGVSVVAPGGAFASVPNWTSRGTQLMSGTSMSSPNCCGCLALILSGLKEKNIEFNPFGVKRAIQNTAIKVDEILGSGAGLIQVEKAFDYMINYKDSIFQKIHFDVKHQSKNKSLRGIYIKTHDELYETRDYMISIEPIFFENKLKTNLSINEYSNINDENLLEIQREKISLNKKVVLVCENNDNASEWVECPSHLYIVNSAKQFHVRIHSQKLQEGRCYFTQIKAYDFEDPNKTVLFRIPITVVKPYVFDTNKQNQNFEIEFTNILFKQGQINRHFFRVPFGSTHAELSFNCDSPYPRDHSPLFTIQSFTLDNYRYSCKDDFYRLNSANDFKNLFNVQSNKIIQICIGKNWSSSGNVISNYKIKFNGLYPLNSSELCFFSSKPNKVEIGSYLRNEDCEPSINWKHHIQPLKPIENSIELVKPIYGLLKPIYQTILTYNFHQVKTGEISCQVPLLSEYLYENEFQSIFWMIFESNTKRFMLAGDSFPDHYKYSKSLNKGDYTIRLHIRHDKIESLEKLKDLNLHVKHTLNCNLNQDIFNSHAALIKGSAIKSGSNHLQRNTELTYYINSISEDKLPKGIACGSFLSGELTLYKDSKISKVDKHQIYYFINNSNSNKKNEKSNEKASSKAKSTSDINSSADLTLSNSNSSHKDQLDELKLEKDYEEAVRDVKVAWILKSNEVFQGLKKEYENYIPIYINRIQYLQQKLSITENKTDKINILNEIVDLSKLAIGKIDENEILRFIGEKNHDSYLDDIKKNYENQKNWMIDLLVNQGIAFIERNSLENNDEINESLLNETKSIYKSIQKYIDITDEKVSKFFIKFLLSQNLYGKALKILFKQMEDKPATINNNEQSILNVLKQMNLNYVIRFYENHLILRNQKQFTRY